MPKLQVLWCTANGVENDWEVDYIKELLDATKVPYDIRSVKCMEDVVPNALIVINHSINYIGYLVQYERMRIPFGVIHLSDEWFHDCTDFYNFSMCKFAYRNYYHESFEAPYPNLRYLALGYKYGFWEGHQSVERITVYQRKYVWSFAGAPRSEERKATIELFKRVGPHLIHWEMGNSFNAPTTGLSTEAYRDLLLNTTFGLCPIGNSPSGDSFRVTEVLECGGIPIVCAYPNSKGESYWKCMFGEEPPFVIGNTWDDCVKKVEQLVGKPQETERMRLACYTFWTNYKACIARRLASDMETHLRL